MDTVSDDEYPNQPNAQVLVIGDSVSDSGSGYGPDLCALGLRRDS